MKLEDKKEMIELFNEGFTNIVLPHIEKIYQILDKHNEKFEKIDVDINEIKVVLEEHGDQLDSIDRKVEPQFRRTDEHDVVLEKHEKRIGRLEIKMVGK
jgi:hypothetical protein